MGRLSFASRARPLVAWVFGEDDKEALIPIEPDVFFTLSHHDGHPSVLVRLAAIDIAALREVTVDPWRHAPWRRRATYDASHRFADPE